MSLVIFVQAKFGDCFRRFSVPVNENNQMEISMVDFRAKICSAFNFTANAKFIMSYVDEDGDIVRLVDNDDLEDVMKQRMEFLKIDITGNGILPLEFSQWRNNINNNINKYAGKIDWTDEIVCYGAAAFVMWAGLCSAIIFSKPKSQPPVIVEVPVQPSAPNVSKGGWWFR
ncbi:PB1-Joka2 domain protein [Trifolium pratense]|uniref:PB1-Joka2 domain protein n=1 Tax=Trifolium pratense TaxID=57577 RepID=A0A2K3KPX6_TRIPR|nr:PB1-Joka2 domain protein [Trifolium pratense]